VRAPAALAARDQPVLAFPWNAKGVL